MTVRTLSELFRRVREHDRADCLIEKRDGSYQPISARELATRVQRLAKTLDGWGVRPGDRVAMMCENGPNWATIDFAIISLGAVSVPIYSTLMPEGAAYVVRDSGAKVLFVQGEERLAGLLQLRGETPSVERAVAYDAAARDGVVLLEEAISAGAGVDAAEFEGWLDRAQPADLATLIYTSGTTGDPKGVMLTHRNLCSNVSTCCAILPLKREWTALSFLPLAHSLERTLDYAYLYSGVGIAYAESVQTVAQNLVEVQPHVFGSVPRIYEKVRSKVLENVLAAGGLKKRLFDWALAAGIKALPRRLAFQDPGWRVRLADRLVFSKIRARLGGRFEYAVSGGAPLGKELGEFFWAAGIPLLEGYGLTETSPVLAVNTPQAVRLGTVGRPIPEVEIKIAEDGEILAKGPNIMQGYFGKPGDTAEAFDSDGWFKTGDIGTLDADGFLAITDRKKEILVNAYGKNIAPAPIEGELKAGRWISQAVLIGDSRPFLVALLVPNFETLAPWAAANKLGDSPSAWIADERVRALFQAEIDRVNEHHQRYEQVRAFELLPRELTLEAGEMTPTMKVRRRVVHQRYRELLDRLYAETTARGGH